MKPNTYCGPTLGWMGVGLDHREFIGALGGEVRRELTELNNSSASLRLGVLGCLFALNTTFLISRPELWLICSLIQGLLLMSLFHLLHECVHDTVFKLRWLNRLLASVCGFALFLPSTWFRYFHHAHHRYTQQPDKDPELLSDKPKTKFQWLWHVSGINIWKAQFQFLGQTLLKPITDSFVPERQRTKARREVVILCGLYIGLLIGSLALKSTTLLVVWLIPLLIGQPFLRLYLLAEHTGCSNDSNMIKNTRTVLTNPLVRWFTWNMPYHTEHHVFPTVPFHQLPKLHAKMNEHLIEIEPGYIEFNRKLASRLE